MFFKKFKKDESGAVTVDWVVMTAAVVGIGIATTAAVSTGLNDTASDTSNLMESDIISTSFDAAFDFLSDYFSVCRLSMTVIGSPAFTLVGVTSVTIY